MATAFAVIRPSFRAPASATQEFRLASTNHTVHVCTRCHIGTDAPGRLLIDKLRDAIDGQASPLLKVGEIDCMAGCNRPLTVGFSAPGKASYLFGDMDAYAPLEALLAFAEIHATRADGWTNEGEHPAGLAGKIIARIPAPPEFVAK